MPLTLLTTGHTSDSRESLVDSVQTFKPLSDMVGTTLDAFQMWSLAMPPESMPPGSKTLKMYALTGIVKAVKTEARKIMVHNAYIQGVKEPIERDYELYDAGMFPGVQEGDAVHATVLTDNADIWLLDEATFTHRHTQKRWEPPTP
jgi:hypothetical protein